MSRGFVRIISGKWRGKRLSVPDIKDLRPTPDRVRETLFNWLTMIPGAHCLDLFAGTGALGIEALSRGAAYVEMIDQSATVVALLKKELALLKVNNAVVYQATIPQQIKPCKKPFDIVFIDPPYQSGLLFPCCFYLENKNYLAQFAYIYLEAQENIKDNDLPPNWRIVKSKTAGHVHYHLAIREKT